MTQTPQDKAAKSKLQVLLFQLTELLKDPPIIINLPDWRDNVEGVLEEIGALSPDAYDRLQSLVAEAIRRAVAHVGDLDNEAAPNKTERSYNEYFTQVAFVTSEINAIKSL